MVDIWNIIKDSFFDTLSLLPFLFIAFPDRLIQSIIDISFMRRGYYGDRRLYIKWHRET